MSNTLKHVQAHIYILSRFNLETLSPRQLFKTVTIHEKINKHTFIQRAKTSKITLLRDEFGSENITKGNKQVITVIVRLVVTPARRGVYDQK